mgnify:FL=1|jgi:hypothetical protein|tara:strand:- start:2323 stop:2940 length:618 start_codon:yes stop_codon:yes gene_type:complete
MANEIERAETPALPLAPEGYERPFMDQNSNVLRLFFNRIVNSLNTLFSTDDGGKFLYAPRGSFYSTQDQTATSTNTGYAVTLNTTNYSSNVTLSNNSRINVTNAGVYKFDVTLQLEHNNSSETSVIIWEQKNGTAISYSGHKFDVEGNNDHVIHWAFTVVLAINDYIEVYWSTGDTQLNLHTEAASSPHPGLPSASIDVSYISNS